MGHAPADRNLISGNSGDFNGAGVAPEGAYASGTVIEGNFIGTDVTGTLPLGNGPTGPGLTFGEPGEVVGGTTPGAGNLISGNYYGIFVYNGAGGAIVEGNFIGTDVTGAKAVGNTYGIIGGDNNLSTPELIGGTDDGQPISQGNAPQCGRSQPHFRQRLWA